MALALDEVVEADLFVVGLDKRLKEVLTVAGQDEVLESILVPVDILDLLDVEFHYKNTSQSGVCNMT